MSKLILISGKKRSGKNYFAERLQKELNCRNKTSRIIAFADPIKEILSIALGIRVVVIDELKNTLQPIRIGGNETNMRKILQRFGTDAMQSYFGPNVWVDLIKLQIEQNQSDYIIVPDFRFKHEYIECNETVTVNIINTLNTSDDYHRSENELNDFMFDYTIDNTGYKNIDTKVKNFVNSII